jgi:hypothetical protein
MHALRACIETCCSIGAPCAKAHYNARTNVEAHNYGQCLWSCTSSVDEVLFTRPKTAAILMLIND